MPSNRYQLTGSEPPTAFLIGVEIKGEPGLLSVEDSLEELAQLARTIDVQVLGRAWQHLDHPDPATYIGSGKLQEIHALVQELQVDLVIFDDELSPRHQRELEKAFGDDVQVLDRTALILDIFARHAHTREGALQVELAQYEYRLPRLTGQWTHLARQVGGGGGRGGAAGVGLRGPGETQLEVDRREISRRIAKLKKELEEVRQHRRQYRRRRRKAQVPVVSIIGYTNAGKSTLLNALSGADVAVADQLFATLDPTTRRVELPGGRLALFTDTVGFIQKLPTMLVAAFRATLEEIGESDLLLHVIDFSHPNAMQQRLAVLDTLADLDLRDRPMVVVLNKIDRLPDPEVAEAYASTSPDAVAVSAAKRLHLDKLLGCVEHVLYETMHPIEVLLPYSEGNLLSLMHEQGSVDREESMQDGVRLSGRVPVRLLETFRPYQVKG